MYRLNQLQRNVLITPDEVIFHAPTDHTCDSRKIINAIIIAEERFIRPALTYELYEQLIDEKNLVITSGNIAATRTAIEAATDSNITIKAGDIINAAEYLPTASLKLWKQHLWKLVAECVLLIAMPDAFVQFGSSGVIHPNPPAGPMTTSGVVTPSLGAVKWTMDKKLMDRIDPLTEAMHLFICKNKTLYPNYDRACDCDSKGVAYKRKTNYVLRIYDDEPKNCKCAWDQLRPS
jgi:hypothetical protein